MSIRALIYVWSFHGQRRAWSCVEVPALLPVAVIVLLASFSRPFHAAGLAAVLQPMGFLLRMHEHACMSMHVDGTWVMPC